MNEYPRPTGPDPQLPQAPQTSGAYPNQPQNQYGQNQAVNSQISQPYMQNHTQTSRRISMGRTRP